MDELGSAMGHSDEPNFKVAPFLFMPSGNLDSAVRYKISDFSPSSFVLVFFFVSFPGAANTSYVCSLKLYVID